MFNSDIVVATQYSTLVKFKVHKQYFCLVTIIKTLLIVNAQVELKTIVGYAASNTWHAFP